MDIRIDGLHERAFLRLMEANGEKTIASMARVLIRDAAIDAGVWHDADLPTEHRLASIDLAQKEVA